MRSNCTARAQRPAFTLIELLVVIVIISVLISVAVTVAGRVTSGGRSRLTQDVLRILDQTRTAASAALEGGTPSKFVDGQGNEFPIIDGLKVVSGDEAETTGNRPGSIGLYFLSIAKVQGLDQMFKGIDPKLIDHVDRLTTDFGVPLDANGQPLPAVIVHDAFADHTDTTGATTSRQAIRFVHPTFDNGYGHYFDGNVVQTNRNPRTVRFRSGNADLDATVRRSYRPLAAAPPLPGLLIGDADEGICTGKLPYFYSIGPDGDPGGRGDNLYTTKPTFPLETAKYNN